MDHALLAARLERLAGLRATYTNLLSESSNRAKLLERAEQGLNNARATLAGAKVASLISPVDDPDTGTHPVSPSRMLVVLGGLLGGLLTGLGVVFLTAPAAAKEAMTPVPTVATDAIGNALVPYRAPERTPTKPAAVVADSRNLPASTQFGLTCSQALKVLSDRGKVANPAL